MILSKIRRGFATVSPYFSLSASIPQIKSSHQQNATSSYATDADTEAFHSAPVVKTGGRIIGRRKASSGLMFLDLESNNQNIQVMVNSKRVERDFKEVAMEC
jgi:lysyl-tRNA synthetase class II